MPSNTESATTSAPVPTAPATGQPGSVAPAAAGTSPTLQPVQTAPQLQWPVSYQDQEQVDDRPETLRHTPGTAIPDGYRLQTYLPRGYIIGGSITFGIGAALGLGPALTTQDMDFQNGWLLVPVLGPFIALLTVHETCTRGVTGPENCQRSDGTINYLAVIGTMQAAGATLFTWGLTHPRQRLVRVERPQLTVAPAPMGCAGCGLAATGTF